MSKDIEAKRARRDLSVFRIQINVIHAIFLRDVRTRFFGSGLGYLVAIAWPLAHIVILLAIYWATGRAVPYGSSLMQFFAVSLCPVIAFLYISRWITYAPLNNKPLMHFPRVKLIDILLARSILEIANAAIVVIVLAITLSIFDVSVMPNDVGTALMGMLLAILLGLGMGVLNAVIAMALPLWATIYSLCTMIIYAMSGVLFVPESLPAGFQKIVAWNPVLHAVEMVRLGYYGTYRSSIVDTQYVLQVAVGTLFLGLLIERSFRRQLMQAM